MRVRVWISGADGPSWDFELVAAPRIGERVSITAAGEVEEGVVESVTWQLQAAEAQGGLALEPEPPGSVSLVHVICRPEATRLGRASTAGELGRSASAGSA